MVQFPHVLQILNDAHSMCLAIGSTTQDLIIVCEDASFAYSNFLLALYW